MKKENGVVLLYHLFGLGWLVGWLDSLGWVGFGLGFGLGISFGIIP